MIAHRDRRPDPVDTAIVQLVRLVLDDSWSASTAAIVLCDLVEDQAVLRRARTRVAWAAADRASHVTERALATLDLAINPTHPQPSLVAAYAAAARAG